MSTSICFRLDLRDDRGMTNYFRHVRSLLFLKNASYKRDERGNCVFYAISSFHQAHKVIDGWKVERSLTHTTDREGPQESLRIPAQPTYLTIPLDIEFTMMQSFQRQIGRTAGRSLPLAGRNASSTISRRCISQQTGSGARDRAAVGVSPTDQFSGTSQLAYFNTYRDILLIDDSLLRGGQRRCSRSPASVSTFILRAKRQKSRNARVSPLKAVKSLRGQFPLILLLMLRVCC